MIDVFASEDKIRAQSAAYAAVKGQESRSTSIVEYRSKGHILVIGNSRMLNDWAEQLEGLDSKQLDTDQIDSEDRIIIQGVLGQFEVSAGKIKLVADIVLDLTQRPLLSMSLLPPGYIVAKQDADRAAVIAELSGLVGTFSKPKFFQYDGAICAHGHSGSKGCTRCLDACPAEAITSVGNLLEIDPYRCQGGGICASVCPSGAMTYAYPAPSDLLTHLRTLISTYINEGQGAPVIAFVCEEEQERVQPLPAALIVTVEEVASVGPEVWLSTLSWGAQSVLLFDLDGMPKPAFDALNLQVEMVQRILQAMSYPAGSVSILSNFSELITLSGLPEIKASTHGVLMHKRQAFYMALDHLMEQSRESAAFVDLPVGSIFGEVVVSSNSCTLCMSCVNTCPGNALQDGGDVPQLGFVEANCLQCSICISTCPEDAITMSPRILLDPQLRKKRRVLHQESPFHCISCGTAFATTSGITTIISRLTGHTMFADERALSRLKMCSDCRVKDMMEDPNSEL